MNKLTAAMRIVLANVFIMYFKAHAAHWNVEGPMFSQYHEFFGDLYDELYGSVDDIAEHIRAIDGFAPFSLVDLLSAGTVGEDKAKPATILETLNNLLTANNETIASINKAFTLAGDNQGLKNYLADRLDKHAKHGWQIKASLKNFGK